MHGNVWEWMLDRRDAKYYAQQHPEAAIDAQSLTNPTTERVLRGGNWRGIAEIGRAAFRDGRDEFHRHYDYGFRVWLPVDSLVASAEKEPSLLKRDAVSQPNSPKP
jgi:formylglycine-generating enzyme required for sulfatase activity